MATSSVLGRGLSSTDRRAPPAGLVRDRFIDAVRAFALLAIVGQHWTLPVLSGAGAILATGGTPTGPGGWAGAWFSPVLPLIFFAGGAAAAKSLRNRERTARAPDLPKSSWLVDCAVRLATPALPLAAVLTLHDVLIAAGVPERPVHSTTELIGRMVWFLAAYALMVTLTPVLARLHDHSRGREVIAIAAGAIAVDVVRLAGPDGPGRLGSVNTVLVLWASYQVGIAYDRGRLDNTCRSRMLAPAAVVVGTLAMAIGPNAVDVIDAGPPATVLLVLAAAQLLLAHALGDALTRWAAHRPVAAMLDWISARAVTIYLWHVPALAVLAGLTVAGNTVPLPFDIGRYSEAPLRLAVLAVVLAAFVRAFGRCERGARYLVRPRVRWG